MLEERSSKKLYKFHVYSHVPNQSAIWNAHTKRQWKCEILIEQLRVQVKASTTYVQKGLGAFMHTLSAFLSFHAILSYNLKIQ